jgi:hypothetical protein
VPNLGVKKKIADTVRPGLKRLMGIEDKVPPGGPRKEPGAGRTYDYDFGLPPLDQGNNPLGGNQFARHMLLLREKSPSKYYKLATHLIGAIPGVKPEVAGRLVEKIRANPDLQDAFHRALINNEITDAILERAPTLGIFFKGELKNAGQLLCENRDDVAHFLDSYINNPIHYVPGASFYIRGVPELRRLLNEAKHGTVK